MPSYFFSFPEDLWSGKSEETTIDPDESEELLSSEVHDYLSVRQQRRWIFPRAALVGACAGVVVLLFRIAISSADVWRNELIAWAKNNASFGWMIPVVFTMLGAVISVAITRRYAPEASGSGIPHLEAVLQRFRDLDWKRVLPVKFFGGILAIGSGLALGREGPTVQMGGAVGDGIARLLRVSQRERLTLISAGAGAGLAAAFNAPLSGLIFVLEEVRRDFQPIVFGAAFIASVIADIIARIGSGQFPVFSVPAYPVPPLGSLPFFALMGVIAGFAGVLFNKALMGTTGLAARIPARFTLLAAGLSGALVGLVGWFSPQLIGNGHQLAENALKGNLALTALPFFFLLRFLLTNASYGTGAPGGIFAPLLVLGALLGAALGLLAQNIAPALIPVPEVFAVVGMAALFTAIVRAPLTGIMLIVEMTGNYAQMLPLLVCCFSAYVIAEAFKEKPIYEAMLERELKDQKGGSLLHDPVVVDFIIQPGAVFAGQQVRYLGLPAGCIIVRCYDGKREWIPKANTVLEAHMRITAVVSPEAVGAMEMLREGCKARG